MIHVVDGISDKILAVIDIGEFWEDNHYKSLLDTMETFDFTTFGDMHFSEHLGQRNRLVIPGEDGEYVEFLISDVRKYRNGVESLFADVKSNASYLELQKAKVIRPGKLSSQTLSTLISHAIGGTEWQAGRFEGKGTRTLEIKEYTDPYSFLKTIATEYNLELSFRVEVKGGRIVGRYVDMLPRVGDWQGYEVELGTDLIGIERIENTENIVTALVGIGPEREDGTRLEVTVYDADAWQRWGRINPVTGDRSHIIDFYEPESQNQDITQAELKTLTENELQKRVNELIEYKAEVTAWERLSDDQDRKIRFGDTIRVKDSAFNPPIYLDARVHTMERSLSDASEKTVTLGDFIEYSEDDILDMWKVMQADIQRRLGYLMTVNVDSSAGDVFRNGTGNTTLEAILYLTGQEVDEDGSLYSYSWTKHDATGVRDMSFARSGKSIIVTAADVDNKATFFVDIGFEGSIIQSGQFTISELFDGVTYYTWIKYADDARGNGISNSPEGKSYLGIAYNQTSATESNDPMKYEWSKIEGEQGPQGPRGEQGLRGLEGAQGPQGDRGIEGPKGADGKSSYTHIAYANSSDGRVDFSTGDSEDRSYIGIYVDNIVTDSNDPSKYNWTLIKGSDGEQGLPGPKGADGRTPYFHTAWADSPDGRTNFSTIDAGERKYIGTYTDYTPSDSTSPATYTWAKIQGPKGDTGEQGPQGVRGPNGADGQSLYTWIKYANDGAGNGMSDSPDGKAYIGLAYNKTTPNESSVASDYTWTLVKGAQGDRGVQGPSGPNGQSLFTWIKYADSATGSGMSDDPNGKAYIGMAYNKTTAVESSNANDYTWSKILGAQGPQGPQGLQGIQGTKGDQGIQGPKGTDGKSSYTHIAYANSADGTSGFSTSDSTNKLYIGIYVDSNANDSTNPSAYAWTLIRGADGEQGLPGQKGADGRTPYFHTAWANNATGTSGFSTTDSVNKLYIGTYTDFTSADSTNPASYSWTLIKGDKGDTGATGPQGPQGPQGIQGPSGPNGQTLYTWIKYADNASGGGMTDTPTNKKYIGIAYNKTSPNESTNVADYTWSLIQGPQGNQGVQGPSGPNGQTYYTWLKYADSPTSGMSDSPANKKYMGIAYNKTTATESSNYADYSWSLIQGPQGDKGATGPQGPQGSQGIQGPPGSNGQSLYTWVKYATNASGGGMADTPAGKTYIGLAYNKTTPTESNNAADYTWSLIQGPQGNQGVQGPTGPNGQTYYTWLKYADSPTSGMSDSPTNKKYMGIAYNKTTATESTNYADYHWSLIQGPQGPQGGTGPKGNTGATGPTGPRGPIGPNIVNSTTQIEANVIKSNHIDVSNLSAIVADLGTVRSGSLTGVTITTDNGLGSKVILNDGSIRSYDKSVKVAEMSNQGFVIYDHETGAMVGNLRDEYILGTRQAGIGLHSAQDVVNIGFFEKSSDNSRSWIRLNRKTKEAYIAGYNGGDSGFGRLTLSASDGSWSSGTVPKMSLLYNAEADGGWASAIVYSGTYDRAPSGSRRHGFEVWQYLGNNTTNAKQMMKLDKDSDGTYASFYTDRSYLPGARIGVRNGAFYNALGLEISPTLEGIHGGLNGPGAVYFTQISVKFSAGAGFGDYDFNFSGAENIFSVFPQLYSTGSNRAVVGIYNQSASGFQVSIQRLSNQSKAETLDVRLMIVFEPS